MWKCDQAFLVRGWREAQQPCIRPHGNPSLGMHVPRDPHRRPPNQRRDNQQLPPSLSLSTTTTMAPESQKPPALPTLSNDEAGVMGLTEVEPSPVDETPAEFKEGYFPANGAESADGREEFGLPRRTTTTLGLGGSHGPVWWCTCRTPLLLDMQTPLKDKTDMRQ